MSCSKNFKNNGTRAQQTSNRLPIPLAKYQFSPKSNQISINKKLLMKMSQEIKLFLRLSIKQTFVQILTEMSSLRYDI